MSIKTNIVFLCFWITLWVIPGRATTTPAGEKAGQAAASATATPEIEGRGEGFQPEGKAAAQEEECPATFGPIITDTAIPIDKGRFALQPTFGLSFITNSLTQSWRRVSAGGDFQSFGMDWKFTYGLWNNLEVFVVIPYGHNWASNVNRRVPKGSAMPVSAASAISI
jgi:hypothetical protein